MRSTWLLHVAALGIALLATPAPLRAHHSFAAKFDDKRPVMLTGTVIILAWTNPHAHIHMDVKDGAGKVTSWDFELGSPNALIRLGWSRNSVKPGDMITVNGYQAKDGSPLANARSVVLSGGKTVFAGSSNEAESGQ